MPVTVTSADVRSWSLLDFTARGYAAGSPDPLDIEVERSAAYVEDVTGQVLADTADPSSLATRLKQAIQLRTEQQVVWRSDDYVGDQNENAIDISVTGYSQKRVGSKDQKPRDMINVWPELNDLLVGLLTDDKRDYWSSLGAIPGGDGAVEEITEHGWFYE